MLRVDTSVRDLIVDSDEVDTFGESAGRWAEADRGSGILPLLVLLSPPLSFCFVGFVLRSSVAFVDVTSFRSSSEVLWSRLLGAIVL
jgi:hypothetical protein